MLYFSNLIILLSLVYTPTPNYFLKTPSQYSYPFQPVSIGSLTLGQVQSPWYRNTDNITNFISVLALLVSGITTAYTLSSQNVQETREKKEELRGIITSLADYRKEFEERLTGIKNQQHQEAISIAFNSRQLLYLEAAEALLKKIPNHVSWVEYWYLANEHWF